MKVLILFCYLLLAVTFAESFRHIIAKSFHDWKKMYEKKFESREEINEAFKNFQKSYKKTLRHSLKFYTKRSQFQMKLNEHAADKDKSKLNGAKFDNFGADPEMNSMKPRAFNLPTYPTPPRTLDYRKLGLVTDVQYQGDCASCYAYSATCGLEGQIAKKFKRLNYLSTQQIIDCSDSFGNYGCDGGYMDASYRYIINNKGIATENVYPNIGYDDVCNATLTKIKNETIISYRFVTGDENYLKSVLAAIGPLPVGMRGSLDSFYYYSSGIFDDPTCNTAIDHAVCLVGYGTDNSTSPPTDYWIVKNSWSTEWGENGYFRLKMGSNLCGIRNYVVYPII